MIIKIPYWNLVHAQLIRFKSLIMSLFLVAYILGFSFIAVGFYLYDYDFDTFVLFLEGNSFLATVALVLFSLTLLPGIFQRFKIFPLFSASIILFRRQLGILMFVVAMTHSFYISTIPAIMTAKLGPEFMGKTEILGTLSLMILLPVWLTSNDFSMRKFGKFWKTIQRLTYFALIVIFFHVAQTSANKSALLFIVIFLEFLSWAKVWFYNKKSPEKGL